MFFYVLFLLNPDGGVKLSLADVSVSENHFGCYQYIKSFCHLKTLENT